MAAPPFVFAFFQLIEEILAQWFQGGFHHLANGPAFFSEAFVTHVAQTVAVLLAIEALLDSAGAACAGHSSILLLNGLYNLSMEGDAGGQRFQNTPNWRESPST
jgi:hypothetical protein